MTDASVVAPSATIEATTAEEAEEEDARTAATPARTGAISLVRTAGKASLVRATGGSSLVRIDLRATQLCLLYLHHRGGMTTITRTRGLGASRSLAPSLASWVALRPQPPTVCLQAVRS